MKWFIFLFTVFAISLKLFAYDQVSEHIKKIRELAITGNSEACVELGNYYFNGRGVPEDKYTAFQWYYEGAKSNNPAAYFNVALCYDEGYGTEVNKIEALRWYRKAAEAGVVQAKYNLAMYYKNGASFNSDSGTTKLDKDIIKCVAILKQCVNAGFPPACRELGKMYMNGDGVIQNKDLGIKLLQEAADKDDPDSLYAVAKYKIERGTETGLLFPMIKKAADNGVVEAMEATGTCYEVGLGVKVDKSKAVEYYTKAAENGSISAQSRLGTYYLNGTTIVKQNLSESRKWFTFAAEQNDPYCIFMLGTFADQGIGEKEDKQKAMGLFIKAAKLGYSKAQYNIAEYYLQGINSDESNDALGTFWLRKAALQDDAQAQKKLGMYYLLGDGVKQSYVYGLNWLNLSEQNGNDGAKAFLNDIQLN